MKKNIKAEKRFRTKEKFKKSKKTEEKLVVKELKYMALTKIKAFVAIVMQNRIQAKKYHVEEVPQVEKFSSTILWKSYKMKYS